MTDPRTLTIDLAEVTETYEKGLLDRLRGFGAEESIFETWVPDANTEKSILNLIDAASEARFDGVLVLRIPGSMTSESALRALVEEVELPANLIAETGSIWCLQVSGFERKSLEGPRTTRSQKGEDQQSIETQTRASTSESVDLTEDAGARVLRNRLYDLPSAGYKNRGSVDDEIGMINVTSAQSGWQLTLQLDPDTHLVQKAAFLGPEEDSIAPLLEKLCDQVVSRPIVDVSDHSISRLEFGIRQNSPRLVDGISLPLAVDERFVVLQELVREAVGVYRAKTGYQGRENFFFDEPAVSWTALSVFEQKLRIAEILKVKAIELGFSENEIEVLDVEFNVRVLVRFSGQMAALETDKQALMMTFERLLIQKIDPRLELFLELVKDQSVLRRLGGKEEA